MDIEEFKKKNKPKQISKLKKFENEILELHNANYSLKSITLFLKNNGLKTTFQNVSRFINSLNQSNTFYKKKDAINKDITQVNHANASKILPKLKKVGKDLNLKEAPDWAN